MTCCQCQGIEVQFNSREAAKKLADYQKNGPAGTTRILIAALKEAGVEGRTLLDIGGGIGAVQMELLKAGARGAASVEASTAYIEAARQEARRQGLQDRIQFHHGDFVELADGLPSADIVTLDGACVATRTWRLWLAYQRAGREVYTVPARESYLLRQMPYNMAREIAALWLYYARPIAEGRAS